MKCGECNVTMVVEKVDEYTTKWTCPKCNKINVEVISHDDV